MAIPQSTPWPGVMCGAGFAPPAHSQEGREFPRAAAGMSLYGRRTGQMVSGQMVLLGCGSDTLRMRQ